MSATKNSLFSYLVKHIGEPLPKLRLLSAQKVPIRGTLEEVVWGKNSGGVLKYHGLGITTDVDIETSYIKIKWDNGNVSETTMDLLGGDDSPGPTVTLDMTSS